MILAWLPPLLFCRASCATELTSMALLDIVVSSRPTVPVGAFPDSLIERAVDRRPDPHKPSLTRQDVVVRVAMALPFALIFPRAKLASHPVV
jgi:hypothetical protein